MSIIAIIITITTTITSTVTTPITIIIITTTTITITTTSTIQQGVAWQWHSAIKASLQFAPGDKASGRAEFISCSSSYESYLTIIIRIVVILIVGVI